MMRSTFCGKSVRIFKKGNFCYLDGKIVLYQKTADIVWRFIGEDENNYKKLQENLRKYKNIYQSEWRSFDIKSELQIKFKEYKDKEAGKDPNAYKNREDISSFEQKPIYFDDFTKEEEQERLAEKIERRNQKRHELAKKTQRFQTTKTTK